MCPVWHFVFAVAFLIGAQVFKKPASGVQDRVKAPPLAASLLVFVFYFLSGIAALLGVLAIFSPA